MARREAQDLLQHQRVDVLGVLELGIERQHLVDRRLHVDFHPAQELELGRVGDQRLGAVVLLLLLLLVLRLLLAAPLLFLQRLEHPLQALLDVVRQATGLDRYVIAGNCVGARAGFRLAALDLELRGAGNILGGQQSGHLDALGFDLYTKMLERTIAELRGDEIADETSVSINLGIDVSIPKDYIAEPGQRLRTYKRISSAESEGALMQIHAEIEDRYGRIPPSVENLFEYGRLRKIADEMNIVSIDKTRDGFAVKLSENAKVAPERLMAYLAEEPAASFSPNGILRMPADEDGPIRSVRSLLEQIRS